jgi:hypothetical protein
MFGCFAVVQSAGLRHQVDDDFIRHSDYRVARDVCIGDLVDRPIFEDAEGLLDARHVVG